MKTVWYEIWPKKARRKASWRDWKIQNNFLRADAIPEEEDATK